MHEFKAPGCPINFIVRNQPTWPIQYLNINVSLLQLCTHIHLLFRIAKRLIDGKNFYGGSLHVFYAPELESIVETKAKLAQRRREISFRVKKNLQDFKCSSLDKSLLKEQYHRRRKQPALPLTKERLTRQYPKENLHTIYNGIPAHIDPRPHSEPNKHLEDLPKCFTHGNKTVFVPKGMDRKRQSDGFDKQTEANNKIVKTLNVTDKQVYGTSVIKHGMIIKFLSLPHGSIEENKIVIRDPSVTRLLAPSKDLQESILSAKSQIRMAMQTGCLNSRCSM